MKKIFICVILSAIVFATNKTIAQSANRTLSNLATPTKINVGLLPDSGNTHNLGSASRSWKNIYMKGFLFLDGQQFIANPGIQNTFIGSDAGKSNTSGYDNTTIGYNAMFQIKNGYSNVAVGNAAMYHTDSGYFEVAVGDSALYNERGYTPANTAIGGKALYSNTTGYINTAEGAFALFSNTTGIYNVANGANSLLSNVGGSYNTAIGSVALEQNVTGNYNTAVGCYALDGLATGNNNSAFGYSSSIYNNLSNATAIGNGAYATASNEVRIGADNITSIGGAVNWSVISDSRVKKNIKHNIPGLAFINKLLPVTYNLDLDAADKIIQRSPIKDKDGKIIQPLQSELDARAAKQKIVYTGFIAQDVEKAAKGLNYDFSGVDAAKNDHDLYGLRYAEFVVPLVKAVQELSQQNDSLKKIYNEKLDEQQKEIDELKAMIVSNQSTVNNQQSTVFSSASLQQNTPNPFSNSITIHYTLPQQYSSAQIIITNNSGVTLKNISLNTKGNGSVNIDASTLSSGAYQYSLIVDGKIIGSKQMMLAK